MGRRAFKNWSIALASVAVGFSAIAIIGGITAPSGSDDGAGQSHGYGPELAERKSAPQASGYVHIVHWENDGAEDLRFCAGAGGQEWSGQTVCWDVDGKSKERWHEAKPEVWCRVDMTDLEVSIWTVDGDLVNVALFKGNFCHGRDHGYEVTVTSSYRIAFRKQF